MVMSELILVRHAGSGSSEVLLLWLHLDVDPRFHAALRRLLLRRYSARERYAEHPMVPSTALPSSKLAPSPSPVPAAPTTSLRAQSRFVTTARNVITIAWQGQSGDE